MLKCTLQNMIKNIVFLTMTVNDNNGIFPRKESVTKSNKLEVISEPISNYSRVIRILSAHISSLSRSKLHPT